MGAKREFSLCYSLARSLVRRETVCAHGLGRLEWECMWLSVRGATRGWSSVTRGQHRSKERRGLPVKGKSSNKYDIIVQILLGFSHSS